jgi:hypothetical protein
MLAALWHDLLPRSNGLKRAAPGTMPTSVPDSTSNKNPRKEQGHGFHIYPCSLPATTFFNSR